MPSRPTSPATAANQRHLRARAGSQTNKSISMFVFSSVNSSRDLPDHHGQQIGVWLRKSGLEESRSVCRCQTSKSCASMLHRNFETKSKKPRLRGRATSCTGGLHRANYMELTKKVSNITRFPQISVGAARKNLIIPIVSFSQG